MLVVVEGDNKSPTLPAVHRKSWRNDRQQNYEIIALVVEGVVIQCVGTKNGTENPTTSFYFCLIQKKDGATTKVV